MNASAAAQAGTFEIAGRRPHGGLLRPAVAEELIRRALHPYPEDLVIATKAGFVATGPGRVADARAARPSPPAGRVEPAPARRRANRAVPAASHRPRLPAADEVGTLAELQQESKIRHIGLSEVSVEQLEEARETVEIVSVQNL